MAKAKTKHAQTGPIANFERWFSSPAISKEHGEVARQDCRLGLLYEMFRRQPAILSAKRQEFLSKRPGWNPSEYKELPLLGPWDAEAFTEWERPWRSATLGRSVSEQAKRSLIEWSASGAEGPKGVPLSVSKLLRAGESEVCKYVPPKIPLTFPQADKSGLKIERDVERLLLENNDELEKHGWKLFAIDCRSKDAVKQAVKYICDKHVPSGRKAHGRLTLRSWASRLCDWNERCAGNRIGQNPVVITEDNLKGMIQAWADLEMASFARPLSGE